MEEEKILPPPPVEEDQLPEAPADREPDVQTEPETTEEITPLPEPETAEIPEAQPENIDTLLKDMPILSTDPEDFEPGELTEEDEQWLNALLASTEPGGEILADETAVAAAGLTKHSELELEQIIQETQSEDWGLEEAMLESQLLPSTQGDADPLTNTDIPLDDDALLEQILNEQSIPDTTDPDAPLPPEAEVPQEPEPPKKAPPDPLEKGRPKRKQGYGLFGLPHLAATAVWLAIILVIGISIGRMAWLCAADVLALGREPKTVTVTIDEDDTITDVAAKLKDAGLIRYPGLFKMYADFTDAMEDIKPGTYTLNPPDAEADQKNIVYDYMALVTVLSPHNPGQVVVSDLRIPEGYTCAQIFSLLEEKNVCTVAELEAYVAGLDASSLDYWFLEGVQWGDKYSLEGYLFPNTYDFYENDKPERVLKKLLDSFDASFTDSMKADLEILNDRLAQMLKANGYSSDYIETNKFTIREVVIIASMIEKETANNLESFTVSSVIYNRLTDPDDYPYLNIDATIVYALGGKSDLTDEDLKIDHPYNTYTNPGLTPGAISNPSQNSLAAALDPSDTNYYFYAFDPSTGEHHFSETYQEHLDFLATLREA